MDKLFDELSRVLVGATRRRDVVKSAVGLFAAAFAGSLGFGRQAGAASLTACRAYCSHFPVADSEQYFCMHTCLLCPSTTMLCGTNGLSLTCCPQFCVSGVCEPCPAGLTLCADGQCYDLSSDVNNCGACGASCADGANVESAICVEGGCYITCNAGFADCNDNPSDGCEVNTNSDVHNCGACGKVCPQGANSTSAYCSGGNCGVVCATGYADCDSNPSNGCETNIFTSVTNCGGCGTVCASAPNASPTCVTGRCTISCNPGFANCDGNNANGCEVNTNNDVRNCGGCGTVCASAPNASPTCASGRCSISCYAGFADCDGNPFNGCEVNINSDRNNCGACGHVCAAGLSCVSGVCM